MNFSNLLNWDFSQILVWQSLVTLLRFAAWLIIGIPLVIYFSRWIRKYATQNYSAQQGMIYSKLVLYGGITLILLSILNEFGFKLSHILGAAGIVGIAIGFASQTSVSNIISGMFLIAEKPFEVNDIINVGSVTGVVLSIDFLSIKIRSFDNRFIRIPNETIIKSEVTNITHFPIRRVDFRIGVAYKEDLGRVKKILQDLARENPDCLNEPEPTVIFTGFGNSSMDILYGVWVLKTDWLKVKNSMMESIKKRFDEEGVEIPFPHLSLYSGSVTEPIPVSIINQSAPGLSGKPDEN